MDEKVGKKLSLYDELRQQNWLAIFISEIKENRCELRSNGKYYGRRIQEITSPWVFTNLAEAKPTGPKCHAIHTFIYPKMKIIPSMCFDCYKVVVKPLNVAALFDLLELQRELNLPAKCGVDHRPFASWLYGGYFYNEGLEAGQKCYETVTKQVYAEHIKLHGEVILKRGCTELEREFGRSDEWQTTPEQLATVEDFWDRYVYEGETDPQPPEDVETYVKLGWIRYAALKNDMSYLDLTGNQPLQKVTKYVEYQDKEK